MSDFKWFVFGKKPLFADYISLGDSTHLTTAFKNWVFKGFQAYICRKEDSGRNRSYRFLSKGGSPETLALGLLQSSADSFGRPYPLLFIGSVHLPDWQKRWPHLVAELDEIWAGLEEIAGDRCLSLQDMPRALAHIVLPAAVQNGLQKCPATTPNAVFSGNCDGRSVVISFTRPLTTQDFVRLWTT